MQADRLARYRSRLSPTAAGGWSIAEGDAPDAATRAALARRRDDLCDTPPPAAPAIGARVSRLFLRFPATARMPDGAAMVAAYVLDLQRYPLWAIDAGLASIIRGAAAPQYAPTSLQVQAAVEKALRPVRDEIAALSAVLDASLLPDQGGAARDRVKAGFTQLRDDLAHRLIADHPGSEAHA